MSKLPFDLDRWYRKDESISDPHRCYCVYEGKEFVCTGLTQLQASDFCRGASLFDTGSLITSNQ